MRVCVFACPCHSSLRHTHVCVARGAWLLSVIQPSLTAPGFDLLRRLDTLSRLLGKGLFRRHGLLLLFLTNEWRLWGRDPDVHFQLAGRSGGGFSSAGVEHHRQISSGLW